MRRALRYFFTLCSALSLLLCVAVCVLWVLSYRHIHTCGGYEHRWEGRHLHVRAFGISADTGGLLFFTLNRWGAFEDDLEFQWNSATSPEGAHLRFFRE